MQKKNVVMLASFALLGFLTFTSFLVSNKQFLSLRRLLGSKASETASTPIQLTVSNKVIAKTSNNILGYSTVTGIGGTWSLEQDRTKNLYRSMNSGLNRIVMEGVFNKQASQTLWTATYNSKSLDIKDGRLHLQKLPAETKGNWVYTEFSATNLIRHHQYTFSFDYDAIDLQRDPDQDFNYYRIGFVSLGYLNTFDHGIVLNYKYISEGTKKEHITQTFTYEPTSVEEPEWIRIYFWLNSPGELYIDNVKLSPVEDSSLNFVKDPDFETSQSGRIISPKDIDDNIFFVRSINQEPILTLTNPDWFIPEQTGLSEAAFTQYVLNHPNLSRYLENTLDEIDYNKKHNIKYYEFGNEPELWWHNTGGEVRERYYLYGKLYAMLAKKAKTMDPNIQFGLALYALGEGYKASIDGLFDGIHAYEQEHAGDSATTPVPLPDFFTTHAVYQLRAWGATPKCSKDDMRACIYNLFTYAAPSGKAYCNDGSVDIVNMNDNVETLSFVEPYLKCTGNYLKTKGIANPKFIPTEWGPSGSNQDVYYYYGSAVWTADRLGRIARSGIFGQNFLAPFIKGNSTYPIFSLYAKFLTSNTSLLETTTSADDKVSMYTFKNPGDPKLYGVITNRLLDESTTPVTVTFPPNVTSFKIKERKINCRGTGCAYSLIDQKPVPVYVNDSIIRNPLDAYKAVDIVNTTASTEISSPSNSLTISMENHSVLFWEIETVETQVPVKQSKVDFNTDGKEDVLWRNEGTGENVIWFMNGTSLHNYEFIDPESTSQKIVAAADFNTDGSTDILWRDSTNGEMTIWLMNGTQAVKKIKIETPSAPGTAFDFAGLGDLNGDNSEDIILRNKTTGENGIWYLNRTSFIAWDRFETAPVEMSIQTIADLDHDGKDDIVWRNNTTGDVSVWLMDYKNVLRKTPLLANVPAEWVFMGKGDFNKDGSTDLFWRNTNTGDNGIWFMKKDVIDSQPTIANQSIDWYPAQFSDFNTDGYTDILWRNKNNGAVKLWLMQSTTVTQPLDLSSVPLEWFIQPRLSTTPLTGNPSIPPPTTSTPTATVAPTRILPTPTLSSDTRGDSSECERRYGSGASCETAIDCIRSDGQVKDTFCDTGKFCCVSRR